MSVKAIHEREMVVDFEKIVPEGRTLGRYRGKVVFAYGVLPGERALVEVKKRKRTYLLCNPKEILKASPLRREPLEDHYLSCSPWQIMGYEDQLRFKEEILREVFYQMSKESVEIDGFHPSQETCGYRTKIEYSFTVQDGRITLAFHERGNPFRKIPLKEGCILGSERMNRVALSIVDLLNERGVRIDDLKHLVVRESKGRGELIATLFVKSKEVEPSFMEDLEGLDGFILAYSDPLSPTSVLTETLATKGKTHLEEVILGRPFLYPFNGFFQNHIPLFERSIEEMRKWVDGAGRVVELYSGVGVIGLLVKDLCKEVYAVESDPVSSEYAAMNARRLEVEGYRIIEGMAEDVDEELLSRAGVLLLDPPRAGVHKKVIKRILRARPKRIIYLSCNPATQARDYSLLKGLYTIRSLQGFDFYPQTPHLESLLVMDLRV